MVCVCVCGAGGVFKEPGSSLVWYLAEGVKNYTSMEDVPQWDGREF